MATQLGSTREVGPEDFGSGGFAITQMFQTAYFSFPHEISESRDYLEQLRKSSPKSRPVTRLLADVYQELGDWNSLVELMPVLKKLKTFAPEELEHREQAAYDSLITSPALLQGDTDRAAVTWQSLPASRKKNPVVISSYVNQLVRSGDMKEAETILRRALNKQYN